jgi:hypothetical protein
MSLDFWMVTNRRGGGKTPSTDRVPLTCRIADDRDVTILKMCKKIGAGFKTLRGGRLDGQ